MKPLLDAIVQYDKEFHYADPPKPLCPNSIFSWRGRRQLNRGLMLTLRSFDIQARLSTIMG